MVVEEDWVLNMEDGWSRAAAAYRPVTEADRLRATEEWACRVINSQTAEIDALKEEIARVRSLSLALVDSERRIADLENENRGLQAMVAELSRRPTVDQWKALMASAANPFGAEPELAPAPAWLRLPVRNPLTGR